jgi:hypothetical protein
VEPDYGTECTRIIALDTLNLPMSCNNPARRIMVTTLGAEAIASAISTGKAGGTMRTSVDAVNRGLCTCSVFESPERR